jgi:soluble lytic murein transglycosylase-like protein
MSVMSDLKTLERRIGMFAGDTEVSSVSTQDASRSFQALIRRSAAETRVDPVLIEAVIARESAFDSRATSAAGAHGLMQLMPSTAVALGVSDSYDPEQNIRGGARYLRLLLDRFNGNVRLALAAYNAGPGAVERYAGIPPYKETRAYVGQVLSTYESLRRESW